jgi:amino acid adenylation domain-containing protein/thioester reductase-like protein
MIENKFYPLTHPQQRIWYTEKLHPGTSMWNNAGTLKIKGPLNLDLIVKSINLFIKNNEAMRIRITEINGEPFQYVSPFAYSQYDYLDFSAKGLQGLYEWDSMQSQSYLPLLDRELFYIAIVRISNDEFVWYAKVHHIISDAWSLVMFSNQVMEYYDIYLSGGEPAEFQGDSYTSYIRREQEYLNSKRFLTDKLCLNEIFSDIPEPTVLKQKKTNYVSTRARRKACIISKTVADHMRAYCEKQNVSIFALYLSVLCIYINRILGKDDIVIGVPVFNRSRDERNTVGMFVSTVPIRIKLLDDTPFDEFVKMVSGEWFRILKHQKYPYELLLSDLRKKHKGLDSLYDITLSYQNVQFEKNTNNFTYEGRWHFSGSQVNSLNIHINDREGEGRLIVDYDHQVPLFSIKEIEYIHDHCLTILTDAISHPYKKLFEMNIMPPEELKRVLCEFNANKTDFTADRGLDALFQQQMNKTPDEIALISGTDVLTYRQLNALVNKAAYFLINKGLGRDDIAGIMIAREYTLIVSILAVLRAGAAFLPIDPDFPADRVQYELKESGAKCVIASLQLAEKCDDICEVIPADILVSLPECGEAIQPGNRLRDLAYVIYTSGSTGKPKGVMVEHHSIVHFMHTLSEIMDFTPGNIVLSAATVSFDLFIMETFPTLLNGGAVVLAGETEHNIPQNLVSLIIRTRINKIMTTPSRMQLFLSGKGADECLKSLKEIMLGGDVLPVRLLNEIKEKTAARIFNFYGPTEVTIAASYKELTDSNTVNIGKPLPGVYAYILDKHKNPVPIGVHGELYIGGDGVSRGYLDRPELTAESFVSDPFKPGWRIYKTGDMTRWFPMGEIEYLGRVDQQVKIRGFRIEPGEIEAKLLQIDGISACAVVDRQDDTGRKYLCAYICGTRRKNVNQLRGELAKELPAYMVPSYFIWMDSLPLGVSGKVDRKGLPEPDKEERQANRDENASLSTATEKGLAEIWGNVLKLKKIGREDNFFDIGGDSLSIVMVSAEVYKRFQVEVSLEKVYENPTLENFAKLIDGETKKNDSRPIISVRGRKDYPVSAAQRQVFIVSGGFFGQNTVYNMPGAYYIKGSLDIQALQRSLTRLVAKNESFRTRFEMKNGELRQRIVPRAEIILNVEDCAQSEMQKRLNSLARPFDLKAPPLLRANLLRMEADEFILFLDMHHIIADGTSVETVLSQLSRLYAGKSIPSNMVSYKDYSVWQEEHLASGHVDFQRRFWMDTLGGDLPTLNLNTDYPRGAVQSMEGNRLSFSIPKDLTLQLRTFAQRSGVTMFMLLLSLYTVVLSKYTGQKDIIVGAPVSVRNRHELMDIVGMFVNTLPMRTRIDGDEKFTEMLERVRAGCLAAFQNQTYPFELMVNDLKLEKDASRNPVFGTMLSYNTFDLASLELKDLKTTVVRLSQPISKFDITLEVYDKSATLECEFEYCTKLFKRSTLKAIALHFKNLIKMVLHNPEIEIKKICLLTPAERKKILVDFNRTGYEYDEGIPVIRLFERAADRYPDKIALICKGRRMTFSELDRAAGAYAKKLIELGVGRNRIVGISVNRSLDMMCAILGTLKAGAAYMPVDPFYPEERKTYMLQNSKADVLITDDPDKCGFQGTILFSGTVDKSAGEYRPVIASGPGDLALVIYTSGSTGRPKGVMVTVSGLLNLYEMIGQNKFYSEDTVVASISSISFDIFVSDSLISLFFGAAVIMCTDDECRQPHLLVPAMRLGGANFLQTTPSRMQILMGDKTFRENLIHLKLIVHGGEPFPPDLLRKLKKYSRARIVSVYGPTETTVYSSFKDLTHTSNITVGKAAANLQYYILDEDLIPVPLGCPGLLYIAGKGVSRGYINREDLTRERYLRNPFAEGIMYNSGDICAYQPSGEVVCLGRSDFQVKIRGLRIELGEIESAILDIKGVDKTVVLACGKEENKYLCAYFTQNGDVDETALRESLKKRLPVYMIPSHFISLESFPMTPGGKLDRKALPNPGTETGSRKNTVRKKVLTSDTQKKMAKVWKQVLKVQSVGPADNFFHLGGDSLAVIQVQAAIWKYGFEIGTQDFYEMQTLESICEHIDSKHSLKQAAPSKYDIYASSKKGIPLTPRSADCQPADLSCTLLTGANGFLGAHVLSELVGLYQSRVYCIIRADNDENARQKLKDSLVFYFGKDAAEKILKNVQAVSGEICSPNLGMPDGRSAEIAADIKTVIHCAAITSHYGMPEKFEEINVLGTKYIVEFCLRESKPLLHVSTMSVSGKYVREDAKTFVFDETCYYIGQEYGSNEYVKSKFFAEGIVHKAREEGLDARIFRAGNLTARTIDGKFQMAKENNAFANRLKSIFEIGVLPEKLKDLLLELTPVDSCAKTMLILSQVGGICPVVYHLYNPNRIFMKDLIAWSREILPAPAFVPPKVFDRTIRAISRQNEGKKLSGIINDISRQDVMGQNIEVRSDKTAELLHHCGFDWPQVSSEYVTRFLTTICEP